jgi:hypothetical protein
MKLPTYTLTITPLPQGDDPRGLRRLRAVLKVLLRVFRLRVVRCEPSTEAIRDE